jgi:two-component system, cell cycle response regulator
MVLKPKILIVDDEPRNVKLLSAMLTPDGYETMRAYNGEDALKLVKEGSPDLILLDIMMPGLNGYEVCQILKKDPKSQDIPIIMVTAFCGNDNKIKGIETGADEFLDKPVNTAELLARVRSLLRLKQYQDQLKSLTCSINSFTATELTETLAKVKTNRPSILIVEDNELDAQIIQRFLDGEPYELKFARDGEEALCLAQQEWVDLILMDLLLPGKNGFEVYKNLKEIEQTKNIQIVAITCLSDLESKVKGIESGADDYLVKPVNKHELKIRVKSLIKKKAYLDNLCARYEMAVNSAITDKLTGLYNRSYFDHFLDLEIKRSYRQKTSVALLMLDIDNFKQINDTFGHLVGDRILNQLGGLIKSKIRETDLPARYGGEEFAVVMPNTNLHEAEQAAERLRQSIQEHRFDAGNCFLTVSIGVALYPLNATSMYELINKSDRLLYLAKNNGKNQACTASSIRAGETH